MTDTRRDRVARVIETAMREVWNGETLPSPDHVADALLAEGLIAPEGMSADDLEMAAEIVHICGYVPLGIRLRAWASALAVADREATRGVRVGGADRMSAETRETLLAAAALLERDGWCQGWYNDEHGRRCLDEALHVTTTPSTRPVRYCSVSSVRVVLQFGTTRRVARWKRSSPC